mgnify:FL=1|tara:strand:+ start:772 stop:1155 length:384 start_codon:yes stop_codon:yes gene_type:complete
MAETDVDEVIDENIGEEITEEATQDLPDGANLAPEQDGSESGKINSDVLQNIPVTISVEVGRTSLKIRDLMRLTQGSVVELDRIAGEPLDLLVNDTLVAQGEVVLVNERYGVRLTQVIPAAERVKNL